MSPVIKVEHRDKKYVIVDEQSAIYGSYDHKSDAEAAAKDWRDYYAKPSDQ